MFESAILTAISIIGLMLYFDIRKIAGFAIILDFTIFVFLMWAFEGTYSGMMTGFIAGLIVTCFLRFIRYRFDYKALRIRRKKGQLVPLPRWTDVPAHYKRKKATIK
jgi:hypothetical protein